MQQDIVKQKMVLNFVFFWNVNFVCIGFL